MSASSLIQMAAMAAARQALRVTPSDLTELEIEILRECAGEKPPRAWGAHVGACLEFLHGYGLVQSEQGGITDAGRAILAEIDGKEKKDGV